MMLLHLKTVTLADQYFVENEAAEEGGALQQEEVPEESEQAADVSGLRVPGNCGD